MAIDNSTNLRKDYSKQDFVAALEKLLPPGKYWHSNDQAHPVNLLLDALGQELKTTHDETQGSLLIGIYKASEGWKLSDFQHILDIRQIEATVTDNSDTPNMINIQLSSTADLLSVFRAMNKHRLAHSILNWTLKAGIKINISMQATIYQRLNFTEG